MGYTKKHASESPRTASVGHSSPPPARAGPQPATPPHPEALPKRQGLGRQAQSRPQPRRALPRRAVGSDKAPFTHRKRTAQPPQRNGGHQPPLPCRAQTAAKHHHPKHAPRREHLSGGGGRRALIGRTGRSGRRGVAPSARQGAPQHSVRRRLLPLAGARGGGTEGDGARGGRLQRVLVTQIYLSFLIRRGGRTGLERRRRR